MADIKKIVKKVLGIQPVPPAKKDPSLSYNNPSYSQEGEDRILARYFGGKEGGFYVDIGAHHPHRFSNTYLFYLQGWRGLNIDAMPGSMKEFEKWRPEDINIEAAVSSKKQTLVYHIFNEPALNTFSKEEALKKDGLRNYKITGTVAIETFPLSFLLEKYLQANQPIDFMSIDVEGLDFDVLQSNDWERFKPGMILIESLNSSLELILQSPVFRFLKEKGYTLVAKSYNTLFFKQD